MKESATYTIYFGASALHISTKQPSDATTIVERDAYGNISCAKLLKKIDMCKSATIITSDPKQTLEALCREFKVVHAAGGVVENEVGELLMIRLRNRWDLPKGHIDQGESDEVCAVREIAEETGVEGAKIVRFLCNTFHAYGVYGVWELKRTAWYEMSTNHCETKPQAEEDILQAKWCTPEEVEENLRTTYPTIRNVFATKNE